MPISERSKPSGDAAAPSENPAGVPETGGEAADSQKIYDIAVTAMEKAYSDAAFLAAAEKFRSIPGFRDADALAEECLEKAETARKDAVYDAAKAQQRRNRLSGFKKAAKLYRTIPGWKDADRQGAAAQKAAGKRRITLVSVITAAGLLAVSAVLYIFVIAPAVRYGKARDLYEAGRYKEALVAFRTMQNYRDSEELIASCEKILLDQRYENAVALMEAGRYKNAIAEFKALYDYRDSAEKLQECRYAYGTELYDLGRYKDAIMQFTRTGGYLDSREKTDAAYKKHLEEELFASNVGESVYFGSYEQDNEKSNGNEYIEWRVLEKSGEDLFLISVYALDSIRYNDELTPVTWADCTLRTWLNGTFFDGAFNPEEQQMIRPTEVSADGNPEYETPAGNATSDRLFLLSAAEVEDYASLDYARQCKVTDYCIEQGVYAKGAYRLSGDSVAWWWLRTPGMYADYAAYTLTDGSVFLNGRSVVSGAGAVRPAMWIRKKT